MKYGVKIYEGKEIIEQRIIETKDEKLLDKIIGNKTHRFWNGGNWTEPRFVIKVEIIENKNERYIGTIADDFINRPRDIVVQNI